jgi:hypothetical protein
MRFPFEYPNFKYSKNTLLLEIGLPMPYRSQQAIYHQLLHSIVEYKPSSWIPRLAFSNYKTTFFYRVLKVEFIFFKFFMVLL